MILAFEPTWTGTTHAPFNAAMLRIAAVALPAHAVRIHANATHLDALARDPATAAIPRLERVPVRFSPRFDAQTHIVSAARFAHELAVFRAALARAPREPCLILLLSATPTAIWAAALAARMHGLGPHGVAGIHVALHGNLNDAVGWRPRNPVTRAFDLASTLRAKLPAPVRFIVFEPHIRDGLARIAPSAAVRADMIPHPIPGDLPPNSARNPSLNDPIRVGFVGLGTRAKGIDAFLEVAAAIRARYPDRARFHMLGEFRPAEAPGAPLDALEEPPTVRPLPRAEFARRMARLDYVMLPFRPGYYDLSPSGALMDAIAWGKPIIATRVKLTIAFQGAYGDIGHLAPDVGGLADLMERLVLMPDPARHAAQAESMRRASDARTPAALAMTYRDAVLAGFARFGIELASLGLPGNALTQSVSA